MWIDSHAHLCDEAFDEDRNEVLHRALSADVKRICLIGSGLDQARKVLKLAKQHDFLDCAIAFHPEEVLSVKEEDKSEMFELMKDHKVKFIGEIGLDYYWVKDPEVHQKQKELFVEQIGWANQLNKPITVHSRDAADDTYQVLKEHPVKCKGIMHSFSYSEEMAFKFIELGYLVSLAGPVTFKNAHSVKELAKRLPIESILIETDSPYLTPHPFRGKRNESSYVAYTGKMIAELKEMDEAELMQQIEENYLHLIHPNRKKTV